MIFRHLEVSTKASALLLELIGFHSALYQLLELSPTKNTDVELPQLHLSKYWKSGAGNYESNFLYLLAVQEHMLYLHHLWIQLHCNLKCKSHHIFLSGVRSPQCTLICKPLCCYKVQLYMHICQPLLRLTKSLSGRCCFARCAFVELTAG